MRIVLLLAVVAFICSHGIAAAQFRFDFRTIPARETVLAAWPEQARKDGTGGSATVLCDIREVQLTNCKVISQKPEGAGFGDALLSLAPLVRMQTMSPSGCLQYFRHAVFAADWPVPLVGPDWRRWPDAFELAEVYPANAKRDRLPGEAVIECGTNSDGGLANCRVIHEAPEGHGFGAAALALVPAMALKPATAKRPVAGNLVLPLNFVPTSGPMLKCR